jgi:hypothetical protein
MCRFYSIRLWHNLLAVGPTGIFFARDPSDAIFNPRIARTKFQLPSIFPGTLRTRIRNKVSSSRPTIQSKSKCEFSFSLRSR